MSRIVRICLAFLMMCVALAVPRAQADGRCRLLILGAMPVEIGPFLDRAAISDRVDIATTNVDGHKQSKSYFFGSLAGHDVIMAMTGIGTANAHETTELALEHFGCIEGVVFSGVSGGNARQHIGDVLVATSWTLDLFDENGTRTTSSYEADTAMLEVAAEAAETVTLPSDGHVGDFACAGVDPATTPTIHFDHVPSITVGGEIRGRSSDPFAGHPLPCVPGTDTFGCQPCEFQQVSSGDPERTVTGAQPFATPFFFLWFQTWSSAGGGQDVGDMESAAVAKAAEGKAPFIAFRSPSDGAQGDPLPKVPGPLGFLPKFFAYRQFAADNAAAVTLAFLRTWDAHS